MRIASQRVILLVALAIVGFDAASAQDTSAKPQTVRDGLLYWAFAVADPGSTNAEAANRNATVSVPGSSAKFTMAQTQDLFSPPDWHPEGHPAMPGIVAHGRKPTVYACGYCHLPNGQGRPENSSLAGLPAAYILQQVADFKHGLRKSSEPRAVPIALMIANETKAEESELAAAANYFTALKAKAWIRVVETESVPKTRVSGWMLVASESGGSEPIGERIIEMPENLERTELRDDASGFVAYVPAGSIKRGEVLVKSGDSGKTLPCLACHGLGLKGQGNVPSIAGRSPSYIVRQLYDMQSGARDALLAKQMKPVVSNLKVEDMLAIAAYLASMKP